MASTSLRQLTPNTHDLVGPFPAGRRPEDYDQLRRRVMWAMPHGLYLLGSRSGDRRNLMTTTWVTQVSHDPKLVGASVEREALTHELIASGRSFTVSLLSRADRAVVRHFVRPAVPDDEAETLSGMHFFDAQVSGAPIPDVAVAWLDCSLERSVELGSHTLFIGQVVDASVRDEQDQLTELLRVEDTRMNYGG
jgi:flavin reductase (DIM6/NTAB) family NADH-FMN oxidoreductase RutF